MKRSAIIVGIAALLIVGAMNSGARAAVQPGTTATWVGGASGEWNAANAWQRASDNTIGDAATILGSTQGSNGANSSPTSGANIIIGGGSTVEYYAPANGDMRVKQGSNLIIRDGATLVQETDVTYTENAWTQMDPSNLILDGGTYRRTGASPGGDGGGLLLLGSWRSDDNFAHIPAPAKINVLITNGGSLQNEGDLWFGAGDDTPQ
ncbi:MAG: hypothetical protein H0T51_24395, partial [Pirellulales bacterium]|nr:hypothetical protein [Pirellulales bacterium]